MTISSTDREAGPFIGNDSTTALPFDFKVFTAADILVIQLDVAMGMESTLALNTDYTVSLNADQNANPGGTVTLTSPLATGFQVTITSDLDYLQPTDLTNQGGFYPRVINDALDRLTIFIQQILSRVNRSIKLPLSVTGVNAELPIPESNKIIGWNETATGLQNIDAGTLATLVAYGTANADLFSGDGIETQFELSDNPGALNNLDVAIGGVTQTPGVDYTWASGLIISFTSPPPLGTNNILVRYMQGLPTGTNVASQVTHNPAGTGAVATTVEAQLRFIQESWINVKDAPFYAKGDGVTDDTAAIQAALNSGFRLVYVPAGEYLISAKLLIPPSVGLVGETTGIGGIGGRGSTLLAADSLTDFILENAFLTITPLDPFWHCGRVEYIQFRGNPAIKAASGFNVGPFGDSSVIRNCKFIALNLGLKVGGTGTLQGVQVSCNLDTVAFYNSNTGLLFENCQFTAGVRNIMLDGLTKPVHFKNCGTSFHCNIDQWHAENLPAATEIFHVDNCSGSFCEVRAGYVDSPSSPSTLAIVLVTRTSAANKARVKVANASSSTGTHFILNDTDVGVSWTQNEVGLTYPEICHNFNTILNSGQGGQIFGKNFSGTWTPVISDAASGGNIGTANVIAARFQRIGNMVFVQLNLSNITTTGLTAANALFIRGLPFPGSGAFSRQIGSATCGNITNAIVTNCSVSSGSSAVRISKNTGADALVSDFTSGSAFINLCIAYAV